MSAVVDVNSTKRATYCIQVTLSTLYIKLNEATALDNLNKACPYDRLRQKSTKNEMCFFWKMVFDFQVNYLMFIRSECERNSRLYILALRKTIKWYFIFNKFNYSRWLSVHLFDLMTVETMFPYIYENVNKGLSTFQKLENQFFQMALDQLQEQNNRIIKSCGGVTDLVNKAEESAFIQWEMSGPDVSRIISEFEESMKLETPEEDYSNLNLHHEDSETYRKKFSSDVKIPCKSMTINPFSQTKLMTINNSHVIPDVAFTTLKKMEDVGEKQFIDFLNDRLIYPKVSICETIPKNIFCFWYTPEVDAKKPFTSSNSEITKMRNAYDHRPEIAKIIFDDEILNVLQRLGKS